MAALRFYRTNLESTLRRLSPGPWHFSVAVTHRGETEARVFAGLDVLVQSQGDLGVRMSTVFRDLPPGPAIIIGSDIPGIAPVDIAIAFQILRRKDAVFGPATDGGYWLVGLARRRPVPRGFMTGVRWSGPHALSDTIASLPPGYTYGQAGVKDDVDTGVDYACYRSQG